MSSVNYSLNNRGVRLIDSQEAFIHSKNGKSRPNPKYVLVGKIHISMPNMLVSATENRKLDYKGDTKDLSRVAKKQIVDFFYNERGHRNNKKVAYFGIEKKNKKLKRGN